MIVISYNNVTKIEKKARITLQKEGVPKMLKRKIYDFLLAWSKQKHKKALCIFGARQIGKTTVIREFAKNNYKHFVELNFILDTGAGIIFEGKKDANTIITNPFRFSHQYP